MDDVVIGELVTLRSGGPTMAVCSYYDDDAVCRCQWFAGKNVKASDFPCASLEKVPVGQFYEMVRLERWKVVLEDCLREHGHTSPLNLKFVRKELEPAVESHNVEQIAEAFFGAGYTARADI